MATTSRRALWLHVSVLFGAVTLVSGQFPAAAGSGFEARRPAAMRTLTNAPPSETWLAETERSLEAAEYEASENARGLQAPNRAQNLRMYFEANGVLVENRTASGDPALVGIRTARVGRMGAMSVVSAGQLRSEGRRVENRRAGLVEWYENGEAGLEHGYELVARPEGRGPLRIELAFDGARISASETSVEIETLTGRRLDYGKLRAWDAAGRALESRFDATGVGAAIVVDDTGATYPLTIDPILTGTADATLESNQAGAALGFSVAGAGDVNGDGYADVIVGARLYDLGEAEEGASFVFLGSASGIASGNPATASATLQSNQVNGLLGSSVAGAGDVNGDGYSDVIVGAPGYGSGEAIEGVAFVFLGSGSGIMSGNPSTASATLQSDQVDARLGASVAGAGDVNGDGYADVIVSALLYDAGQMNEGAAFVFLGSASGVASGSPATSAATIQADQGSAELGTGVSGAGDVNGDGYADVIVGAPFYDSGETDEGAAFVYLGSASGIAGGNPATAAATLQANQADALLGVSVAGAGDVNGDGYSDVIVGASGYSSGQASEGAAFVFLGSASGVASGSPGTSSATLQSDQVSALLGVSVAGAGDVNGDGYSDVIVGAWFYDSGQTDEGAAFVFLGSATGVASGNPATANATLQSNQVGALMGFSVAGAGDVDGDGYTDVIAGVIDYDAGEADEGAAFVFLGSAYGIADGNPATAAATLQSNQSDSLFGASIAGVGDVNGDGYSDVIVGAQEYDLGESEEGAAFLFLGSATGIASTSPKAAAATFQANQKTAFLGNSVAGAGDVNGDGYADIILGATYYNAGLDAEGAAFIFLGSASGIPSGDPSTAATTLRGGQANANLGIVDGAGDVNGDGYADVIVGAYSYESGETNEGAAFVFHGSASGIPNGSPATAAATLESNQSGSLWGLPVAGAGDVNGDGYADVIVGAQSYDSGESSEGAAFVFLGSASGVASGNPATAAAMIQSNQVSAYLGVSVDAAGDVNGDGYGDVIVGAPGYSAGETGEGAAFVFHGSSSGIASGSPATADTILQANQTNASLGSAAGAGDVNGDGYADVVVGAYFYDAGETGEGAAFVFLGSASGIPSGGPATAATTLQPNQTGAALGIAVSAGDVNGDGFADVVVGAPRYDAGETDEGAAFVFHGNGGRTGRDVRALQLRGNASSTHVQPWGSSYAIDGFQVRIRATHPSGRGRVKLEVEACPAGSNWGGMACVQAVSPAWTDVTASSAGVPLTVTVPGLAADTEYRWRARVQYAPFSVTMPGIIAPPNPAHGPWRRLGAQSVEADIRTQRCQIMCPPGVSVTNDPGTCGAVVKYTLPSTTGNCGPVVCDPPPGSTFQMGVTTVTCTEAGGESCSFTVTVADAQPPTIQCPPNVIVPNAPDQCGANVSYATPTPIDNCPGTTVSCLPASGSFFPVGTTTVTCTARDTGGNQAACSFTVRVDDTQPPAIACPANITTTANALAAPSSCTIGKVVTYANATATDNCAVASVSCVPASGSFFPTGTTTVTCTAKDAANNQTTCAFTVTVNAPPSVCFRDDYSGDTFFEVVDATSPLYGFWRYRTAAGTVYCAKAEFASYVPGRSLVSWNRANPLYFMNCNANLGARTATVQMTVRATGQRFTLRDSNTNNNPPCVLN